MENLLESNERTLVIFDAVCSGLAECLDLVHADIKHMTEHRNQLAQQVEYERQQVHLQAHNGTYTETDLNATSTTTTTKQASQESSPTGDNDKTLLPNTDLDVTDSTVTSSGGGVAKPISRNVNDQDDDDSHHLAQLKLLDKRLADSFSQALSMCNQKKSSLAKHQDQRVGAVPAASNQALSSLFQILLGRGNKSSRNKSHKGNATKASGGTDQADQRPPDNRLIIDDINRQTRLAMQYSKQLEANLFKVEDLRAKYEMHLKMGLVVKSVSRAYLANPYTVSGAAGAICPGQHSPNSLGRAHRVGGSAAHHQSSFVVNDSSSLGTTTRSSLSSLNLSTWSFSRRQHSDRSAGGGGRKHSAATAAPLPLASQVPQPPPPPSALNSDETVVSSSSLARNRSKYGASTISLDSMSKRNSGLNLSRLISASNNHSKRSLLNSDQSVPMVGSYQEQQQQQMIYQQCQCGCPNQPQLNAVDSPIPQQNHHQFPHTQQTPSSRPLSQYVYGTATEFATPTTQGTLAGGVGMAMGANHGDIYYATGGAGGGVLHKSASHSSLKKLKGGANSKSSALYNHSSAQLAAGGGTGGSSKTTIKEFIDNIERIEAELESYMGSFLMNIEDIQGFARVCQGDVFEINIRYGHDQKFKTKISVLKDNRQKCDHKQTVFKARTADLIAIKAYECKGLGKKVLLGHKMCETRDLFMARSQLMTISLNQTGSIKLNLVITWNPLHMTPNSSLAFQPGLDISHISLPPTPVSPSTLSSLSSAQSSTNSGCGGNKNNNNTNTTTMISIKSSSGVGQRRDQTLSMVATPNSHHHEPQGNSSPANVILANVIASPPQQVQPVDATVQYHYPVSEHQLRPVQTPKVYQDADTTYGYYIPEPDYLTSDLKY